MTQTAVCSTRRRDCDSRSTTTRQAISVVIPCFNEAEGISRLAKELLAWKARVDEQYRIDWILVDDGSTDGTLECLHRAFADWDNITILRHEINRGITAAVLTGIRAARTEIVCCLDSDCSYAPEELCGMIPRLDDSVAVVTASPYHPLGRVEDVPAWRLGLSRAASFLYRCVIRQKLHTYTSCCRVYRRSAVVDVPVRQTGFVGMVEIVARLDQQGHRIVEHPAVLRVRKLGRSKVKLIRTIISHLWLLFQLGWQRLRPPSQSAKLNRPGCHPPSPGADMIETNPRSAVATGGA